MSISMELDNLLFDLQSTYKLFSQFEHNEILKAYVSLATIISGQITVAIEWQEIFVHAISYLSNSILTLFVSNIHTQLQLPEIIEKKESTRRIDVRDVDFNDVKIIKQAGKKGTKKKEKKKEKKKIEKKESDNNEQEKNDDNNAEKREKEREIREKNWEECWNKKLEEKEAREDEAFCSIHGFYPKPKTQTNIWLQVTYGKLLQDVQLCFKKDTVPKPPPPPLPPLKIEEFDPPAVEKNEGKGKEKKKKKKKKAKAKAKRK
ncbi:uncharacterized protein DDB_G0279979-like [Leptopilina heterotoma]|uniref:uncharacterized protein DDB_G0279979-like n=1 Tax=Leptopilina heterotoma TaxID=63436 RepID=UPI001CA8E349|nr:uncharacterized protein DDB_G0279979-like [Leptopilina heterotoma]